MFLSLNLPETPTDIHGILQSFTYSNTLHVVGEVETQFCCCKLDDDDSDI